MTHKQNDMTVHFGDDTNSAVCPLLEWHKVLGLQPASILDRDVTESSKQVTLYSCHWICAQQYNIITKHPHHTE